MRNNLFAPFTFYTIEQINDLIIEETITVNETKYSIKRHLNSFYQTDENQRKLIHKIVYNEFRRCTRSLNDINALFLGGEMYIYGKIFDEFLSKKIYVTDTKSLYDDAIINDPSPHKSTYHLVSYNSNNIITDGINILISNISKTGLGRLLCEQINSCSIQYLILISCNYKVTNRDIDMLSVYRVKKIIKITGSYDVFISVLELI